MSRKYKILLADYVPLKNKGEQAIIHGIEDMLCKDLDVEIAMFGPEKEPTECGNLTIYPYDWIFESRMLDLFEHKYRRVWTWSKLRVGLNGRLNRLRRGDSRYRAIRDAFEASDLVLVGHDAFFCVENCATVRIAKRAGKRVGVLGAGFFLPRLQWLVRPLYRIAADESDFCVLRERTPWKFMQSVASDPNKPRLEPDPAFAMKPAAQSEVDELMVSQKWFERAREDNRPIIAVTVCEKSVVFNCAFIDYTDVSAKRQVHSSFIAALLDSLVRERNAQIVFLPHSIEEGIGNDIDVAKRVCDSMESDEGHRSILQGDYSGRLLKGVIRSVDFLIGERTHSLISSAAVATPFIGLTNSRDLRTHDILGEMCETEEQLLDMDRPSVQEFRHRILRTVDARDEVRKHLENIAVDLSERLKDVANLVLGRTHA